jgi:hypothetical protein
MSSPDIPSPPPAPPMANQAPDEIANAVDSNAERRKKKRIGSKQLSRGSSGVQSAASSAGAGLTINK